MPAGSVSRRALPGESCGRPWEGVAQLFVGRSFIIASRRALRGFFLWAYLANNISFSAICQGFLPHQAIAYEVLLSVVYSDSPPNCASFYCGIAILLRRRNKGSFGRTERSEGGAFIKRRLVNWIVGGVLFIQQFIRVIWQNSFHSAWFMDKIVQESEGYNSLVSNLESDGYSWRYYYDDDDCYWCDNVVGGCGEGSTCRYYVRNEYCKVILVWLKVYTTPTIICETTESKHSIEHDNNLLITFVSLLSSQNNNAIQSCPSKTINNIKGELLKEK